VILVDTGVWIDWFRDRDTPAVRWLADAIDTHENLCTCGIVLTEILQGVMSPQEAVEVERTLGTLRYLPIGREVFILAAEIYRAARGAGKTVRSTVDCIIAACAIANGASLAQNDRDFLAIQEVSPLKLVPIAP